MTLSGRSPHPYRAAVVVSVVAVVSALGSACAGKPIDPLAQDRARLLALDDEPLASGWPSEATIYLGEALLTGQLQAALDDASAEVAKHPGFETPFGLAQVKPRARVNSVTVSPSPTCDACVALTVGVDGVLDGTLAGPLGAVQREVPFTASATSTLELTLVDTEASRSAVLRPVEGGEWAASAEVLGLPPALNVALSGVLRAQVEALVSAGLLPELPLLDVPSDGPVRVRGVRLRTAALPDEPATGARHLLAVELAFVALERGVVRPPLTSPDGFVVVVPEQTLRGIARAAALRMEPQDGHVAEPLAIAIDDDRFVVELRVWKIAAEPVARDFRAEGRIEVKDGVISVRAERVTAQGDAPLLDPMELLVRAAIESGLEDGLRAMIPARQEEELWLGRKLAVEVTSVQGRQGELLVKGRVVLVPPGES